MTDVERVQARYQRTLVRKVFVRFHMTMILGGAFLAGVVANRLLLSLHATWLPLRYALAVVASYLAFLLLVRLWCAYVTWTWRRLVPDVDLSLDLPWSRGGGGRAAFVGRGGGFGGAGSQGSWSEGAAPELGSSPASSGFSSSGGSGWLPDFSLDIDLDEDAVVIIVAFFVLVLSVAGMAAYMIWNAPSILADAAFQLALSTSLARRFHRLTPASWIGSVWRHTWIAFAIVLGLAVLFGLVVNHYCPGSPTLRAVWTGCLHARP